MAKKLLERRQQMAGGNLKAHLGKNGDLFKQVSYKIDVDSDHITTNSAGL